MVLTQCSILNGDSPDVDENRSSFVRQRIERIEFHLSREQPYSGLSTDPHYLGLSTDLKMVSCHLLSWLSEISKKLPFSSVIALWSDGNDTRHEPNDPGSWRKAKKT